MEEVLVVVGITGTREGFDGGFVIVSGLDLHVSLRTGAGGKHSIGCEDDVIGLPIDSGAGKSHKRRFNRVRAAGVGNLYLHGSTTVDADVHTPSGLGRW